MSLVCNWIWPKKINIYSCCLNKKKNKWNEQHLGSSNHNFPFNYHNEIWNSNRRVSFPFYSKVSLTYESSSLFYRLSTLFFASFSCLFFFFPLRWTSTTEFNRKKDKINFYYYCATLNHSLSLYSPSFYLIVIIAFCFYMTVDLHLYWMCIKYSSYAWGKIMY